MLRLPEFEFRPARTVEEALAEFARAEGSGTYVAGGTDLVPNMKRRQLEPPVLIGIRGISDIQGVTRTPAGGVRLGAGLTLSRLAADRDVGALAPGLVEAAVQVANPQIQRMGTLGGNLCVDTRCNYYNQSFEWRRSIGFCMKKDGDVCLVAPGSSKCWAVSSSDTAPILIALDARVRLAGPEGTREIPLAALYRDDGIAYLSRRPEEILTDVEVPAAPGRRSTYLKVRRRGSFDFPLLGVGAALRLEDGVIREARLVLGAVHTHPVEVPEAGQILAGVSPADAALDAVADAAYRRSRPLDNTDLSLYWRKRITRVTVRRALARLLDRDV